MEMAGKTLCRRGRRRMGPRPGVWGYKPKAICVAGFRGGRVR